MAETTTIVSGQTVFFHELSDQEMDNALQTLPTTQVKIPVLAGQGFSVGGIWKYHATNVG